MADVAPTAELAPPLSSGQLKLMECLLALNQSTTNSERTVMNKTRNHNLQNDLFGLADAPLGGLMMGLLLSSANTASGALKLRHDPRSMSGGRRGITQIDNQPPEVPAFNISNPEIADWVPYNVSARSPAPSAESR